MFVVPWPDVIVTPDGTVHVYEEAPLTEYIEYDPVGPQIPVVGPVIAPGVLGTRTTLRYLVGLL